MSRKIKNSRHGPRFSPRFSLLLAVVAAATLSGAGGGQTGPEDARQGLRQAIAEAVGDPSARRGMQLFAECLSEQGMRSLTVFGDGTGIWDNRRQFQLTQKQVGSLLESLQRAGFAALKEVYGGPQGAQAAKPPKKPGFVIRITCRVEVSLAGHSKQVVQRAKGKQSKEFKQLADSLFETCRKPAAQGLEASSLKDGLQKVAAGQLKPHSWQLMVHRRPDERSALLGNIGFLLRIAGRSVTSRSFDPAAGYTEPLQIRLSDQELEELARLLAGLEPDQLPANLYARDYTDLSIRVLNHRKAVQARQFAGMTASTHGGRQQKFDSIYQKLYQLHIRIINEGQPVEEPRP